MAYAVAIRRFVLMNKKFLFTRSNIDDVASCVVFYLQCKATSVNESLVVNCSVRLTVSHVD